MNAEMAIRQQTLPDRIEDVAQFLLIAPEKATALRAEIRAIKNLKLAQEVYDQKLVEQRMLSEMILDASARVGEFTKQLPKSAGGRPEKTTDSAVASFQPDKTKSEAIRELGFSPKQVERFETLADNKDLVEQVKAESRENGTMPTRQKVLDLAAERKRRDDADLKSDLDAIDEDYRLVMVYEKAMEKAEAALDTIEESLEAVAGALSRAEGDWPELQARFDRFSNTLYHIKNVILTKGGQNV